MVESGDSIPSLLEAVERNNIDAIIKLAQNKTEFSSTNKQGRNALLIAVLNDFTHTAQFLITQGICVNSMDVKDNLPLHYAVKNNNLVLVDRLLREGSEMNILNKQFESPVHIAVRLHHIQVLERLVAAGCNVNLYEPNFKVTPLHLAITIYDDFEEFRNVFHLLLKGNCRVNVRAFSTLETPVYRAIDMCKTQIAELLLMHGADPNLGSPFDVTALRKACERLNPHLVNILLHCGIAWKKEKWLRKFVTGTNITSHPKINDLLHCWRTQVPSLQHLCRVRLRKVLCECTEKKLKSITLPSKIKEYVMLSDVVTIQCCQMS